MPLHPLEDCPQTPVLDNIRFSLAHTSKALDRLEAHSARTAAALEQIAAQGAMVAAHEKRLDAVDAHLISHDQQFTEVFLRLGALDRHLAKEEVIEDIDAKREKFWTDVKLKLLTPALLTLLFILWLADKTGAITHLVELWKEFKK